MSRSARAIVCVCGAGGDETPVVEALAGSSRWEVVVWRADDGPAPDAAAWVAVGAGAARALAARVDGTPLIAVGGERAPAGADCWFPRLPSARALDALLAGAVAPPRAPAPVWRRKSDMIVGRSGAVEQLLGNLTRLAPSTLPVLITGESGTGKELVARALHFSGPRARAPFLALNCAAVPETLFESEIFGAARGAFTGAVSNRAGLFEAAEKGTVFLDELGELPAMVQAKLLRVLETGEVTRLGSTETRRVSARVVCATNRDLEADAKAGRFRQDLYYRISQFPLRIPPLRTRPEDVPPLAWHHLAMICDREKRPLPNLTPAALERLLRYPWPGNVRELVNVLERAVLLAEGGAIDAKHLDLGPESHELPSYRDAKLDFERAYFLKLMTVASGNVATAARLAQKTRKEIYDALKRVGLDAPSFRDRGVPPEQGAE